MDRKLKFAGIAFAGLLALGVGGVAVAGMNDGPGRFDRADANSDGQITRAEWAQAATVRFERLDANKDGKLTAEEMPRRHGHHRGGPDWGRGGPPPPPPTNAPEPGASTAPSPTAQK